MARKSTRDCRGMAVSDFCNLAFENQRPLDSPRMRKMGVKPAFSGDQSLAQLLLALQVCATASLAFLGSVIWSPRSRPSSTTRCSRLPPRGSSMSGVCSRRCLFANHGAGHAVYTAELLHEMPSKRKCRSEIRIEGVGGSSVSPRRVDWN